MIPFHNKSIAVLHLISRFHPSLNSEAMDPISAVSLAGTVVQLVDFSIKIVSKTSELYRSSSNGLVENQSIDKVTKDLTKLNNQLKDSNVGDADLQELCKACGDAADELLRALSKVKVEGKGRIWQSFRKALISVWSKEGIQELEKRLERFRDELNLRLTAGLRYTFPFCRQWFANPITGMTYSH